MQVGKFPPARSENKDSFKGRYNDLSNGGDVDVEHAEKSLAREDSLNETHAPSRIAKPKTRLAATKEKKHLPRNNSAHHIVRVRQQTPEPSDIMSSDSTCHALIKSGALRSSRAFRDHLIPIEEIDRLLEVGNYTPNN